MTPKYWSEAIATLSRQDQVLKKLTRVHGADGFQRRPEPFIALARSIIGQQLSVKAAQSIWQRLVDATGTMDADTVAAMPVRQLRGCGLSANKAAYLIELAMNFRDGAIDPVTMRRWTDDRVIEQLVSVRGIGRWTAEMFLIFHMQRPNVLPLDDAGLKRAMRLHYSGGEALSRKQMQEIARNWEPWCSVATWFMWRSLDASPA